jgi:soluble lytic murein transglycosylase-like protein
MLTRIYGLEAALARIAEIKARVEELGSRPPAPFRACLETSCGKSAARPDPAWEQSITASAARHGLDPALIKAVMRVESSFNPLAVSPAGAQGLMQLLPSTASSLGLSNPFDPQQNIAAGSRYLRSMLDRNGGDLSRALAAYNAGPEAVRRYGGIPPFAETQDYVQRVLYWYDQYRKPSSR